MPRFHLNINGAIDIQNLDVVTRTCDWVNAVHLRPFEGDQGKKSFW